MTTIAEKIDKLQAYVDLMMTKPVGGIPEKHSHRPDVYRTWVKREIETHTKKMEDLKLMPPGKLSR